MEVSNLTSAKQSVTGLGYDDLMALNTFIVQRIKAERAILSRKAKRTLVVGSTVSFTGNHGETITGTLRKKMRKYAQVDTTSGPWRVPMNALKEMG